MKTGVLSETGVKKCRNKRIGVFLWTSLISEKVCKNSNYKFKSVTLKFANVSYIKDRTIFMTQNLFW